MCAHQISPRRLNFYHVYLFIFTLVLQLNLLFYLTVSATETPTKGTEIVISIELHCFNLITKHFKGVG